MLCKQQNENDSPKMEGERWTRKELIVWFQLQYRR
jgi:hypothetical protein